MDFYELLEHVQIKSILLALKPDDAYVWRKMCREYSELFHTPLDRVYELDAQFVLTNLFETEFSGDKVRKNLDEILDRLYRLRDPNYEPMQQEELEDLVDAVLNKEMKRKGEIRKDPGELPEAKIPDAPTQGGTTFRGLDRMDEIAEHNTKGFKD